MANHIMASARPLQMSHGASSILDLIRRGGDLIVGSSWTAWAGTPKGTFSTSCTNWKKKGKPQYVGACHRHRRWGAISSLCWAWSARWSFASSAIGSLPASTPQAKGIYKGRPVTFDRARIGMGATEIAKTVGGKRGNVYKTLKAVGLN